MTRLILALVLAASAVAQTAQLTAELGRTVLYEDVTLSPDSKRVAWVQTTAARQAPQIFIAATAGGSPGAPVRIGVIGPRTDSDPAWSPDSKTLAFFSTAGEKEQAQLWTVPADGGNPRKRTHLKGYAARPRWSRDGKRVAFLHIEGGGGGGPHLAAPVRTGVIDAQILNQRIATLDLGSGRVEMASPADLHVYDYDWSPDGATFVATAAPGPGYNNWYVAEIHAIRAATGEAKPIYKPALQVAVPRWSPDGKSVAFIEGLMSDEGYHGGDLLTMPATGGTPVNHTRDRKSSPSSLFWIANDRILFTEHAGGGSAISELSLGQPSIRTVWRGAENVHACGYFANFALSPDGGMSAVVRSDYQAPPEVWAGPPGQWTQLTGNNASQKAMWGPAESLEWTNQGLRIQGWILRPRAVEPDKRYPMIVVIHGGPSGVEKPSWPATSSLPATLAANGYFVFLPNPRGSYGQGEAFTQANVKDFGGGDLRDILAGVDLALARYPIDPNRLGVTGWSYGGYMTMWTVTQTNRFRAAVAGAGIANWQSYYGQNLIDRWMIPFFGASVYDDPAVYEKSSPIRFIKAVKTPTLVIVGERDAVCPAPQSYEFWHALRTLGVPTELVVYAGEGHMFVNPKNRVDVQDRTLAWFEKQLR
jgi:dipeptidyl aminopeptidase/acylaminoacyl peptidase